MSNPINRPAERAGEVEEKALLTRAASLLRLAWAEKMAGTSKIDEIAEIQVRDAREYLDVAYALAALPHPAERAGDWRTDTMVHAAWPVFSTLIDGTRYGYISERDLMMICERIAALPRPVELQGKLVWPTDPSYPCPTCGHKLPESRPVAPTSREQVEKAIKHYAKSVAALARVKPDLTLTAVTLAPEMQEVLTALLSLLDAVPSPEAGSGETERDAARFRWLCDEHGLGFAYDEKRYGISTARWGDWPDDLRDGVDAAMKADATPSRRED